MKELKITIISVLLMSLAGCAPETCSRQATAKLASGAEGTQLPSNPSAPPKICDPNPPHVKPSIASSKYVAEEEEDNSSLNPEEIEWYRLARQTLSSDLLSEDDVEALIQQSANHIGRMDLIYQMLTSRSNFNLPPTLLDKVKNTRREVYVDMGMEEFLTDEMEKLLTDEED
jgi:hypothetical protein